MKNMFVAILCNRVVAGMIFKASSFECYHPDKFVDTLLNHFLTFIQKLYCNIKLFNLYLPCKIKLYRANNF